MYIDRRISRILTYVLLAIMASLAIKYLTRPRVQSDLERAATAFRRMAAPAGLRRSAFSAGYPDGTPADYVSYLFSDMGQGEWPPRESNLSPDEIETFGMARISMLPPGVAIVKRTPDPAAGRQLVISADDARKVLILAGYENPAGSPVFSDEISFEPVTPEPWVESLYNANLDMGMRDRSD